MLRVVAYAKRDLTRSAFIMELGELFNYYYFGSGRSLVSSSTQEVGPHSGA